MKSITIPDNATNGEVLKALFPNLQVEHAEVNEIVEIECPDGDGLPWLVDEWWWDAPYKGD